MKIAAIIVNWNRAALTQDCVASLMGSKPGPDLVVLIDNGSRVDPEPLVRAVCPAAVIRHNPRNLGFAAAVNQGIAIAREAGAEAVFLLNNDAVVVADTLSQLAACLEQDENIAAAGAKVLTQDRPPRIHTAYGVLTFHGWLTQQRGWLEPDTSRFNEARDVDYVSGCAMLIRCRAFEQVGVFDEEYFAYHEDLDWCTRARRCGLRVRYEPAAVVHHQMHASTGGIRYNSAVNYLSARNSVLFVRKHASVRQGLKFAAYVCGHLLREGLRCARRGEIDGFRLRLRGFYDGVRRRPVPLGYLGLAV
jgi:GT2 family glycosyltransferase